jgi:hypothetical protein
MLERNPLIVKRAKELHREKHRSLREIARELEAEGFVANSGKPFESTVIQSMLEVSWPAVERAIADLD